MLDVDQFVSGLHDYIGRAIKPITDRIKALEARAPERGEKGDPGLNGENGLTGETGPSGQDGRNAFEVAVSLGYEGSVHDWMNSLVGPAGERGEKGVPGESIAGPAGERGPEGPAGRDGADGKTGQRGENGPLGESIKGEKGDPGESIKGDPGVDGKSVTLEDVRPLIEGAVKALPPAKDGAPGQDGSSVTLEEVLPQLRAGVTEFLKSAVAELPLPKDGKDGTSVTVEDIRGLFETEQAKWALDFERRATDLIQRCIDRIEKPKDGTPGRDGRDAFDLENFEIALADDERTLTLALVRGETRVERSIRLNHPIYRGIYRAGDKYQRGDSVTFGGSLFIAVADTESKPESDDSWRLSCKRGRDGRNGDPGARGPEGPKGKDSWSSTAR